MAKRTQRAHPPKDARQPEPKQAWPAEQHSGEGSASALATLQKMEKARSDGKPAEPIDDPAP